MSNIHFFTPIQYNNPDKSIFAKALQKVDDYFYLGGKKVCVIQSGRKKSKIIHKNEESSMSRNEIIKIVSYITIIIPILMLSAKAALRLGLYSKQALFRHKYKVINIQTKLEKRFDVSEESVTKIQNLWKGIINNDSDIEWLSTGNWKVFKLKDDPSKVYKYGTDFEKRYKKVMKGKEVCLTYNLGLLKIPQTKIIELQVGVETIPLIVEESMDIDKNESKQFEHFYTYSDQLDKTAKQLATFVAKTGFNDVTPRNIPIINDPKKGPRKIALIDIEHMQNVVNGFAGDGNGSCGLIGCMPTKELIDIVINEARKQHVAFKYNQDINTKDSQIERIRVNTELEQYYADKNISTGKELIVVDIATLGLDLDKNGVLPVMNGVEDGQPTFKEVSFNMKEVCNYIINEINRLLGESNDNASLKGKRNIILSRHSGRFSTYEALGARKGIKLSAEEDKEVWVNQIIQALTDKGHIFGLEKANGHGYFIQA